MCTSSHSLGSDLGRILGVVLALGLASCAGPPPTLSNLELVINTNASAPLAATLSFSTDKPALATVTIDDGERVSNLTPDPEYRTEHDLMLLGLRPARTHTIRVIVEDRAGQETVSELLELTTDPLPDDFPPVDVVLSRPARMEPGVTLVPFFRQTDGEQDEGFGLILGLDPQGEVIWYYRADHRIDEPRRLTNGDLLYLSSRSGRMIEIDMLGSVVRQWHATGTPKENISEASIGVDTDTFHHDVVVTPRDTFVVLSTEVRRFDDYPSSEDDPQAPTQSANVIGDVVVEFDRDGNVLRQWRMFDILDPYRIGYGSLSTGFYREVYKDVLDEPGLDWTHTNSLHYIAEADDVLMSVNRMSAVVRFDLATGQLEWILGSHDDWAEPWQGFLLEPIGDLLWPWHQHAAELTPDGTVLVFDNGANRARPFQEKMAVADSFSRAVEYRVDEAVMTVSQEWAYGGPGSEQFYSSFISEADHLDATGNVLVTVGGASRAAEGEQVSGSRGGHLFVRIFEVTHDDPAEKVWEIVVDDPRNGWASYRAERVASLYPQVLKAPP